MNKKRLIVLAIFFAFSIAMHFLTGLLIQSSVGALIALSVAAVALAACYALTLPKKAAFAETFAPNISDVVFSICGALLLLAGGVLLVMTKNMQQIVLGAICAAGALGLVLAANYRRRGKNPPVLSYVPLVLFYALKLFTDFRRWMIDPFLLDYCFLLFALIAFMLATYHAGEFSFDRGRRRALTFFALLGFYFGLAAPITELGYDLAIYAGSAIALLPFILQSVMTPAAQSADAAAEAPTEDAQKNDIPAEDAPQGAPEAPEE